jgi:hypothetical protein
LLADAITRLVDTCNLRSNLVAAARAAVGDRFLSVVASRLSALHRRASLAHRAWPLLRVDVPPSATTVALQSAARELGID